MANTTLIFRTHALQRMFERGISTDEVRAVVDSGETIVEYPDDRPYPSQLMLGCPMGVRFMWSAHTTTASAR